MPMYVYPYSPCTTLIDQGGNPDAFLINIRKTTRGSMFNITLILRDVCTVLLQCSYKTEANSWIISKNNNKKGHTLFVPIMITVFNSYTKLSAKGKSIFSDLVIWVLWYWWYGSSSQLR